LDGQGINANLAGADLVYVAKSARVKQTKPEDFFDNSLVQKIQASGFIDSLYARP